MPKANEQVNVVTLVGMIKALTEISLEVPSDTPVLFMDKIAYPVSAIALNERGLAGQPTVALLSYDKAVKIAGKR